MSDQYPPVIQTDPRIDIVKPSSLAFLQERFEDTTGVDKGTFKVLDTVIVYPNTPAGNDNVVASAHSSLLNPSGERHQVGCRIENVKNNSILYFFHNVNWGNNNVASPEERIGLLIDSQNERLTALGIPSENALPNPFRSAVNAFHTRQAQIRAAREAQRAKKHANNPAISATR